MKWFRSFCIPAIAALFIGCSGSTPEVAPVDEGKAPDESVRRDYMKESMNRGNQSGGTASPQMKQAMENAAKNAPSGN